MNSANELIWCLLTHFTFIFDADLMIFLQRMQQYINYLLIKCQQPAGVFGLFRIFNFLMWIYLDGMYKVPIISVSFQFIVIILDNNANTVTRNDILDLRAKKKSTK